MTVPEPHPRSLRFVLAIAGLTAATGLALGISGGNVAAGLAPCVGVLVGYAYWKLPLRVPVLILLFFALAADIPSERPAMGKWESPLHWVGALIFDNLNNTTGIRALRFAGLDLFVAASVALMGYRRVTRAGIDPPIIRTPSALTVALLFAFATVLWLEFFGIARGGDFKNSLWQFRQLLYVPIVGYLLHMTLRGPSDHRLLAYLVMGAAFWKVAMGANFYFRVAPRMNIVPAYVTSHGDTLLFAVAVFIGLALWWEAPTAKNTWRMAFILPPVFLGLILNDRRLAWVTLAAAAIAVYLISPRNRAKRFIGRSVLFALPLLPLYVAVGWTSKSAVFAPVRTAREVIQGDEMGSTQFRDLENYNLARTTRKNPILGSGFGHEYDEVVTLPSIANIFPQYRYIPHNSVLWLWSIGGWVGFTFLWMYLSVGIFLATRAYRFAHAPADRATALVCIAGIIAYVNQAFGDMGVQSWSGVFIAAGSTVIAGKLAVAVGAWPAEVRAAARLEERAVPQLARVTS